MFNWLKDKIPVLGAESDLGNGNDPEQIDELGVSLRQFRKAVNSRLNQAQSRGQIEVRLAQRKIEDTEHLVALSGLDDALVTFISESRKWPDRVCSRISPMQN